MRAYKKMNEREKREALKAVKQLERRLSADRFQWAVRKHLAITALKRKTAKRVSQMRAEIAALERRLPL